MQCNFMVCSVRIHASDLVIVMDKPPLDSSPQDGNTESYSRSIHAYLYMQACIIFAGKVCQVSVVTKIMKNFLLRKFGTIAMLHNPLGMVTFKTKYFVLSICS